MRKNIVYRVMTLCLTVGLLSACTSGTEGEQEKGAIDRMTDRTAKGMADSIQIPLERARAAAQLQEEKMRDLEEAMKDR